VSDSWPSNAIRGVKPAAAQSSSVSVRTP
jgi:hypothetical protein